MGKRTFNYDDLEDWVQKWDKANEDGVFGKSDNAPPIVSKQSQTQNFFGVRQQNYDADQDIEHDEDNEYASLNECDSKYWSDLYELTKRYGRDSSVVSDYLGGKLNESVSVDKKDYADSLVSSANPVRPSTVGNDKSLNDPVAMGSTYDVADLQKLDALKVKLHDLIGKLNGFDAIGSSVTKLESQIDSLQKQIDEMSNGFGKSGIPSQQGD